MLKLPISLLAAVASRLHLALGQSTKGLTAKLADFGTAAIVDVRADSSSQAAGDGAMLEASTDLYDVVGTRLHMAPEIHPACRDASCGYRRSVDIWSIGVLVMEVLAGGMRNLQEVLHVMPGTVEATRAYYSKIREFVAKCCFLALMMLTLVQVLDATLLAAAVALVMTSAQNC